uniref:FBA_2 domain-containing protein n=1 Tax=Steinernema glaseri TaxID=37863 RepID=A0A1I7Z9Q8_9BILA
MEGVPLVFIESVIGICDYIASQELQQLSSAWGAVAEVQVKKSGQLWLTFAPYNGNRKDWRLHYKMEDFDHITTRTLSPEVVKKMSKSIIAVILDVDYHDEIDEWDSIDPDDVNLLQLLANLDAPEKKLDLTEFYDHRITRYLELRSKYSNLFRSFTSVRLDYLADTELMKDTIYEPRVHTVEAAYYFRGENRKEPRPTDFWVDFFFSEKCMRLNWNDRNVALAAIDHWKKMDHETLKYSKVFRIGDSLKDLASVTMKKVDVEAEAPLLDKLRSKIGSQLDIRDLYIIDHPVHERSKIYVVVHYPGYGGSDVFLVFD